MISEQAVEVLTQPERRRRWSIEQKLAIVAETLRPGASATQVARRHGLSTGLLYTWRRLARDGALTMTPALPAVDFIPVRLTAPSAAAEPTATSGMAGGLEPSRDGLMLIELANGRRICVDRHVDAEALHRVLAVLESRR
jgi:transposase